MTEPQVAPYGSWKSPITSDLIASATIGLGQIALDGEDVYWIEMRPAEGGRYVVVRRTPDGRRTEVTPSPFNARTRVHEYGGGAFVVVDGTVYFSNFADQRLYRQDTDAQPQPITPEVDLRYADGVMDRRRGRIICVREDHTTGREVVNAIVSLDLEDSDGGQVLVSGNDFYASPRLSPDGSRLAWLTWNHPNMPWDGTELWVGELEDDGSLGQTERVAGGEDESIFQPEWSPDGVLHFVSDRTGWWNLYRWRDERVEPLAEMEAEFGKPQWVFGMSTYGFESAERIICSYTQQGIWHLASLDTETGELKPIENPYSQIAQVRVAPGRVLFLGGSSTEPTSVVQLDLATRELEVLRRSSEAEIDAGYLSSPQVIEFPTERGLTAHAFFYGPKNRDYAVPSDERPPLLVISHGGPTSATSTALSLGIQYWTSRGIAVLDVNYGGSTGYGREYRQRLDGQWGVVDVDDCVNGARYLVERGEVDGDRLIIRGGSAGGYTTLCALTFRDIFDAGASYYGVSDLEALTKETHKFESRYLDRMVGPYPERRDLYRERSPIHFTEHLSCPVIFFQGLEDRIVPPNQAELMAEALREKGMPVAHLAFEGEQHGFRRAENIKRALDAELYFYSQVFGFELAEQVEPVFIENP
ncbi:MAG: S9 family peptidase [Chloroflexota bacterium]|nr:S9 family peptidase [Chloroflexota bacterium]